MKEHFSNAFFPKQLDINQSYIAPPQDAETDDEQYLYVEIPEKGYKNEWPDSTRVTLCAKDLPIEIRSIKTKPTFEGDTHVKTFGEMMKIIENRVHKLLAKPSLKRVVLCIDDIGLSPKSKLAKTSDRKKDSSSSMEFDARWPADRNPITEEMEFEGFDINDLWYHQHARVHFTEFITEYFVNNFMMQENKILIIDGARLPNISHTLCIAIETRPEELQESPDGVSMFRRSRIVHRGMTGFEGCGFPPAEGELKIISHALAAPGSGETIIMSSKDGDCIFSAALHWRQMLEASSSSAAAADVGREEEEGGGGGGLKLRHRYYIQRSESVDHPDLLNEHTGKPKKVLRNQYVNLNILLNCIRRYFSHHMPKISHPIETFCILTALEGNDYVRKIPWTSFVPMMDAYSGCYEFVGNLVNVTEEEGIPGLYRYTISKNALLRFIFKIYIIKYQNSKIYAEVCPSVPYTRDDVPTEYMLMLQRAEDHGMTRGPPSLDFVQVTAHNLAYYLAYFGNSSNQDYLIQSGLERDPISGLSLHGFELVDESKGAIRGNVQFSEKVANNVPASCVPKLNTISYPLMYKKLNAHKCSYIKKSFYDTIARMNLGNDSSSINNNNNNEFVSSSCKIDTPPQKKKDSQHLETNKKKKKLRNMNNRFSDEEE